MDSKVSIVRAERYDIDEISRAAAEAIKLLGGISSFVKRGQKVLLKPNILAKKGPESGIDTHPEVVRAVARIVRNEGAEVIVGDSPGGFGFEKADSAYEASGIKKICEEENIELVEFDRATNVNGIPISVRAKEADVIISLPKMKTHSLTTITGAIKNSYGLAVGPYKSICHLKAPRPKEFARYVVDVFECAVPRLVIMDGVVAMEGDGPASGGILRNAGLILASNDCVACDSVFAHLIGISPLGVDIIKEAYKRRFGEVDISKIEVLGEPLDRARLKNFKLPKTSVITKIPPPLFNLLARGIKFWPEIDELQCKKCLLCAESCPAGCITIDEEGSRVDYKKCVRCFCCFELCPHNAVSIKRSLLTRLFGG